MPKITEGELFRQLEDAIINSNRPEKMKEIDTILSNPENKYAINRRFSRGLTPLKFAISNIDNINITVITKIIDYGADVNLSDENLNTPIHYAIKLHTKLVNQGIRDNKYAKSVEVINLLIQNNANLETRNYDSCTALNILADCNDVELAETLIQHGAKVNDDNIKVKHQNLDLVKVLIRNGSRITSASQLFEAINNNDIVLVRFLLDNGVPLDQKKRYDNYNMYGLNNISEKSPLQVAIESSSSQNQKLEIINLLIEKGADLNTNGKINLLYTAIKNGCTDIAKILIAKGLTLKNYNVDTLNTLLKYAIDNHDTYLINYLIKNGADINKVFFDEFPVLTFKIFGANTDLKLVECLLQNNANPNIKHTEYQSTLLHQAMTYNNLEAAKILLKYGADINAKDYQGHTPLISATINNNLDMIHFLVENGADINGSSNLINIIIFLHNNSKLSKECAINEIKYLLQNGARVNDLPRLQGYVENCEQLIVNKVKELIVMAKSLNVTQEIIETAEKNLEKLNSWDITLFLAGTTRLEILNSLQDLNISLRKEISIRERMVETEKQATKVERNKDDFTKISKLIKDGNDLKEQVNQQIDWSITDAAGNTLLHVAVKVRNAEAVKSLLSRISPDIKNNAGMTAQEIINRYKTSTKATLKELDEKKVDKQELEKRESAIKDIQTTLMNKVKESKAMEKH